MTADQAIEWELWLGLMWAVWFLYCAFDAPTLLLHWKRGPR